MLLRTTAFFCFVVAILHNDCNASSTPVFLKAISSALGAMPFSGFSMTSGLAGAKLAVGAKLLYYLGLFGRNQSPASPPVAKARPPMTSSNFPSGGQFPGMPMQTSFQPFGQGFPPMNQFANPVAPAVDPGVLFQALAAQGINPLQLMQALTSAGIDPTQLLQSLGGGQPGFAGSMGGPGNRAGMQGSPAFPPQIPPQVPPQMVSQMIPSPMSEEMPQDFSHSFTPEDAAAAEPPSDGAEDIDSFFSFLKDMDDNKCISRLICDIGRDPSFLGEFTQNIDSIISSLDVPQESRAYEYINIMNEGREGADCAANYAACTDGEYEIVKSVAPSVGVPGMSAAAENPV